MSIVAERSSEKTNLQKTSSPLEKHNISNQNSVRMNSYEHMLVTSVVAQENNLVGYAISSENFENLTEDEAFEKMSKILDSFSSR